MTKKRLLAAALMAISTVCAAQGYPSRPITLVVPGPPGGATDTLGRALAEDLGKRLGQPVVVDNKPGGGGIIAVQALTRAAPDGYTVLLTHSAPLINTPFLYANVPYDVRRDLAFVTQLCIAQSVFAVSKSVPAANMQEFLAWAAKNKGQVSYGSFGVGSFPHLIGAHLNQVKALDMTHVAYKGEAPMMQDMLAGNIQWAIGSLTTLGPQIKAGRLRALAVMGERRIKELPDVPSIAEAGIPDPEMRAPAWLGLMARAGTPPAVLQRLETEARASIQSPGMRARLDSLALEPIGNSSTDFKRAFEASEPIMARLIKMSGAKVE